ncbi:kinase-like domain-containing protein [Obelidium mucronatum]|nr:kinase-like domain-containing protein [Obelidium mucronatum]
MKTISQSAVLPHQTAAETDTLQNRPLTNHFARLFSNFFSNNQKNPCRSTSEYNLAPSPKEQGRYSDATLRVSQSHESSLSCHFDNLRLSFKKRRQSTIIVSANSKNDFDTHDSFDEPLATTDNHIVFPTIFRSHSDTSDSDSNNSTTVAPIKLKRSKAVVKPHGSTSINRRKLLEPISAFKDRLNPIAIQPPYPLNRDWSNHDSNVQSPNGTFKKRINDLDMPQQRPTSRLLPENSKTTAASDVSRFPTPPPPPPPPPLAYSQRISLNSIATAQGSSSESLHIQSPLLDSPPNTTTQTKSPKKSISFSGLGKPENCINRANKPYYTSSASCASFSSSTSLLLLNSLKSSVNSFLLVKSSTSVSIIENAGLSSQTLSYPSQKNNVIETSVIYDKRDSSHSFGSNYSVAAGGDGAAAGGGGDFSAGKINQYFIMGEIGSGSYGKVCLCQNEETDRYFACKVVSKSKLRKKFRWSLFRRGGGGGGCLKEDRGGPDPLLQPIQKEIAILKKLSNHHRNINSLVEVLDDEKEDNLYMIFELCEYGPVMVPKLHEVVRPFSEKLARHYFRELLLGIEYLHYNRIIHRDIKPENLLLTIDNTLQISDFGISHIFQEEGEDEFEDVNTSPLFCPPEACNMDGDTIEASVKGTSFDIWSMGITLFCFVHGHCPFEDDCLPDLYTKINNDTPQISNTLSPDLQHLILQMLSKDPLQRPTIRQIRRNEWVVDYGSEPLVSEDVNCVVEAVTEEDVSNALVRISVFEKIRKLFKKNLK